MCGTQTAERHYSGPELNCSADERYIPLGFRRFDTTLSRWLAVSRRCREKISIIDHSMEPGTELPSFLPVPPA